MKGKRQFSLEYFFLEVFWIALALGLARIIIWDLPINSNIVEFLRVALIPAALASSGAAIGGLFGNMRQGAIWGGIALGVVLVVALLPSIRT